MLSLKLEALVCGGVISTYLRIREEVIEEAKFESYGCDTNVAAANVFTMKGKALREARSIDWQEVVEELEGLPPVRRTAAYRLSVPSGGL